VEGAALSDRQPIRFSTVGPVKQEGFEPIGISAQRKAGQPPTTTSRRSFLNTSMPTATPIPFTKCLGLIDLMLTGDERGPSFTLMGVQCSVEQIRGDAYLAAATPDFCLIVVFPGWYVGGHPLEVGILIVGEAHTCLQWLPINVAEKHAIIQHLPLSAIDQTICTLSV
jgi:hypothetical protein